ncbi:MAG: NAD(P)H-hydrate dehydratase [Candidatus Rokubacteria bacterium]|nr:NAD(P)H-hydrate dehydratase [Candidatus Rokubacteria bacterium]
MLAADEMRRLDRRAIAELGIPGAALMESAGRGAADAILGWLPTLGLRRAARVAIICGKGGNGGDGFVVARWLRRRGVRVSVWLAGRPEEVTGDAAGKLAELHTSGLRSRVVSDPDAVPLAEADLVVDALLGTGSRGGPSGVTARLIERINVANRPVVALDLPSGLPADGGLPPGPVIRAVMTTTFAGLKRGLVLGPGADHAGRVEVVPIGIPDAEVRRGIATFLLEATDVRPWFPARPRGAHKGSYGHLLIVAGSLGKTGAAALAARAAMRSGAGLVTVATAASQQPVVASLVLEAMTEALPETASRCVALKARETLAELARTRDAVALGPGLGLDADTQALVRALVRDLGRPLVIDADGLTALAGQLEVLHGAPAFRCLTPHPGEMARMLGMTVAEVERDRLAAAREFAVAHGVHVVLKGAASLVTTPSGEVYINPTGNPGLASGGTGDVLTGMVGAFLARGLAPLSALQSAVYLHGRAGDIAAGRVGQEALIASDVIAALPEAFTGLMTGSA